MLDESIVARVLAAGQARGAEWAEIFVEDTRQTTARLDDGKVEDLTSHRSRGAGIRVVVGETTGYADTSDLTERALVAAAEAAAAVARDGKGGTRSIAFTPVTSPAPNDVVTMPESIAKADKVALLSRVDAAARAEGAAIRQVMAGYGDSRRRILVANTDGTFASDDQVKIRLSIQAVAHGDTGLQTGTDSVGFTLGWELWDTFDPEELARGAARRALTKLSARPAPSGTMPVVIERGGGGVLFHEACGHGLEADGVAKGASVFRGRKGEQVASPLVTLIDDGTMGPEWGSLAIDDEGNPAGRNVLIEDGVLTDYMWDHLQARKEGRAGSTNGRRQSYRHTPMVRMTNTFVVNGTEDPSEIVRQTPHGVYVSKLGGGQVNIATGDFVFGMTEAYLIEDGEITAPLRDANLVGSGIEVLRNIDAVGNDFAMGPPGMCGKDGQAVPVGDGQPTLRVAALTVGGTAA